MKKNISLLIKNKFFQGGFLLTAANFIVGFLNYLFTSLSGKLLGPEKYSEIVSLFSYLVILSVPFQVISTDIIRRLGVKGSTRLSVIKNWEFWFWQKIYRWSFLSIPYFLLILILPKLTNLSFVSSASLLILLFLSLMSVFYSSSLLGLQLFFLYSILIISTTLIKLIGPLLVYLNIDGLNTIILLIILSTIAMVVLGKFFFDQKIKKTVLKKININKRIIHVLFNKPVLIIFLTSISFVLLNNLDVIFVKKFYSSQIAGIYGGWSLFAKIIFYVLSPILSLSFIFFTAKEHKEKHYRILFFSLFVFFIAGIIAYLGYYFLNSYLVLLIFNKDFIKISPYLPQAAIFGILYSLISFLNGFLVAKNSLFSLLIFVLVFFYGGTLFLFGKTFASVININLIFVSVATIYYLITILFIYSKRNTY